MEGEAHHTTLYGEESIDATNPTCDILTGVSMLVCALSLSIHFLSRFHVQSTDCGQVCQGISEK